MPTVDVLNVRGTTLTASSLPELEHLLRRGFAPVSGSVAAARAAFGANYDAPAALEVAPPQPSTPDEVLVSVGTMTADNGTFGVPIRYTDTARRRVIVQNTAAVSIQVGYSTRGSVSPPSWGTTTTVPAGQEFYDDNRGEPLWFRDSAGSTVTVRYYVELGA